MVDKSIDIIWIIIAINATMLIVGLHLMVNPPKSKSEYMGLNMPSKLAPLTDETWSEFHKYSGKIMAIGNFFALSLSLLLYKFELPKLTASKLMGFYYIYLMISLLIIIFTTYILTETHLEKIFDKEGNRKIKKS